jgi:hypothetical protein
MNTNLEQDFWTIVLVLIATAFFGWLFGRFFIERVFQTFFQGLVKLTLLGIVLSIIGFGLYFVGVWTGLLSSEYINQFFNKWKV